MAGRRIAQLALRPGVVDFIDAALAREVLEFAMEEVTVDEHLAGRTVRDLRQLGLFTLAVRHGPAQFERRRSTSGPSNAASGSSWRGRSPRCAPSATRADAGPARPPEGSLNCGWRRGAGVRLRP